MYEEISIPIALDSPEFCDILESNIADSFDELQSYLLDGIWQHNDRAEYVDDSLQIQEIIHIKDNEYVMHYEYEWYAYFGCRDMDLRDTSERSVNFKLIDGKLVFNFLILERRSTDEEF